MNKKTKNASKVAIKVEHVYKQFKLLYDKHYTLKERFIFWKNKKYEVGGEKNR